MFLKLGTKLALNDFALGSTKITQDIYTGGNTKINEAITKVIKLVGGIGGGAFTLAILIIALVIIFGSISAAKMRTVWMALISCTAGALVFYAAWYLAPAIGDIMK
ncbi:hypothetical protein [Metabacillus fastidiosus]|uniref:TrbC/VirB2 family protein n=1 Tax=Metabacillus fastidiosus TaxID=1458 RepID=A0ABU6NYB3_9BACI|nr:hypothetical protein [Metabacillus fastidiosus]MED4402117.1 hypothetical protein [Metabacillus fastidiosus]